MNGQLWEECFCGVEPVCCECGRCERHCRCALNAQARQMARELNTADPGFGARLVQHLEQGAAEQ
jgi:hypothetical protein